LKRYADAERLFEDVVRLTPDHAEAHYSLGLVRERQGRPGDAAPAYREALRLAPTDRERTLSATALTRVEKR
ncbi:MAG TPA: tetratricopeptide repeat protein, partial [Armatimonadaceae bacterium]|nr:tetratricopeptide repeat protein [Armatimonadaceae bacterium]